MKITKEILNEAHTIATKRLSSGLYNRMGFSYSTRYEKAKIGAIGELCFEQFLILNGVNQINNIRNSTGPDNGDFFINDYSLDVKIAKTDLPPSRYWNFGFPVDQRPEKYDFLVVGYLDSNYENIDFYGIIKGDILINRIPTRRNSYSSNGYFTDNIEIQLHEMDTNIIEFLQKETQ